MLFLTINFPFFLQKMVLDVVTIFSQLIRAALIPHTLDRQSPHRAQFGLWPAFSGTFSDHGISTK